jgi:hypothetical protein
LGENGGGVGELGGGHGCGVFGLERGCILTGLLGVVVGKFVLGCGWGFLNGSLKFNLFRLKEPFDAIANGLVFSGCLLGICGSLKWVGAVRVRRQLFI